MHRYVKGTLNGNSKLDHRNNISWTHRSLTCIINPGTGYINQITESSMEQISRKNSKI